MPFPHWGDVPTWGTAGVAFLALYAAVLAYRKQGDAYRKQSQQVDLQRHQFQDQQQANRKQTEVFELQARELRESLAKLEREESARHRAQASRIFFSDERPGRPAPAVGSSDTEIKEAGNWSGPFTGCSFLSRKQQGFACIE